MVLTDVASWAVTDGVAESTSESDVTKINYVGCNIVVDSVVGEDVVSILSLSLVESTTDSC